MKESRKYSISMLLCFILGGFSIMLYIFQLYTAFWGLENMGVRNIGRAFIPATPLSYITSPFAFLFLFNGIVMLLAGWSIWRLVRENEITSEKEKITSLLLQPEERAIISELKKSKGSMTQSQLVRTTGMSKVKAHRIVSKLVIKGIVKKYPYGLTNKIVLEKDV